MGKIKESENPSKGLTKDKSARENENNESRPILPPDVLIEILSRLPFKCLPQVQLVCKEWRALTRDHYFIEKHMGRSSVVWPFYYGIILNSRPRSFFPIHGCDGLLLGRYNSSHKYFIWNPAICRVLELPDPNDGSYGFAFCYVPATRNYRIVSIFNDKESGGEGCEVLTPGHSMSWRRLRFPDIVNANKNTEKQKVSVVSVGGAVHCVLVTKVGKETATEIVTLDLETECFIVNHLPNGLFHDMKTVWELDWDGKLAFVDIVGQNLELMELEDYKKQRWCGKKKIVPLSFLEDNGVQGNISPLFNKQGDIWFWLGYQRIFLYTIKTGKITHITNSKFFSRKYKLYPYKPSLVAVAGMQLDTNLEKFRTFRVGSVLVSYFCF